MVIDYAFIWAGLIAVAVLMYVLLDGFDTAAIGYIAPSLLTEWGLSKPDLAPVLSAALFGLAGGAVTDDGDVQRFHSGDFSVAPAQGSGMQALKNPAGAGFKKIVLDQAAGVMLDACAPFGPWVSS